MSSTRKKSGREKRRKRAATDSPRTQAATSGGVIKVTLHVHPDLLLDPAALEQAACKRARLKPKDLNACVIERKVIDARRGKVRIRTELSLYTNDVPPPAYQAKADELPSLVGEARVAIVGAGPAGLFCAWTLAKAGIPCCILERGKAIRQRRLDLATLNRSGELNTESNYCFGEGGAGTFSDGKLYTRSHKRGSIRSILETLVDHGAPSEILIENRPHIGTNRLPKVITALRENLIQAGVQFHFSTRADGIYFENGNIAGLDLHDGQKLPAQQIVIAPGHSARDVLHWMDKAGAELEFKSFAMGVRIEHPQAMINNIQFGDLAGHEALGSASYRLVLRDGERGIFSFCMCPGGTIVAAATQEGQQVVNGMSPYQRRGSYANSGFIVEVSPQMLLDNGLNPTDAFSGLDFQAALEQRAYQAGGGHFVAPATTLAQIVHGGTVNDLPPTSYHRGLHYDDLRGVLGPLYGSLRSALTQLDDRMPGFVSDQAIAVGVESRSSSPLRIKRDPQSLEAIGLEGVYPCGEGAGYAGGIVSAALDGIRVAEAIIKGD